MKAVLDPTWQSGESEGMYLPSVTRKRRKESSTQNSSLIREDCCSALKTHCLTYNFCFFTKSKNLVLWGLDLNLPLVFVCYRSQLHSLVQATFYHIGMWSCH